MLYFWQVHFLNYKKGIFFVCVLSKCLTTQKWNAVGADKLCLVFLNIKYRYNSHHLKQMKLNKGGRLLAGVQVQCSGIEVNHGGALVMPTWNIRIELFYLCVFVDEQFLMLRKDWNSPRNSSALMTHACRCKRFPGWHTFTGYKPQNHVRFRTTSCDKLLHQKPGFLLWELK